MYKGDDAAITRIPRKKPKAMNHELLNSFLLSEYEKLKDEQQKRIEFRDQMIYLTLGAAGAVFSFALEKTNLNTALLVLPFVCVIMGWTYYSNDLKISSIGLYIKTEFISRLEQNANLSPSVLSNNWEEFSKNDKLRKLRKSIQLGINLGIFIVPGIASVFIFLNLHSPLSWVHYIFSAIEIIALSLLAIFFFKS